MDVAEEDKAQIAKRQAIQAIMRDTSLTAQEKQKKIQAYMASGNQGVAPAPAPVAAPEAVSAPVPVVGEANAPSRQSLMAQVMKDTTLTPQEKQRKIQEIMQGDAATASATVSTLTPSQPEPMESTPSNRGAIQDVMKDASLTPQEKQQKIQQIMTNAPPSAPPVTAAPVPAVAARPMGVGATASTGVDPAARKGARGASTISPREASTTTTSESNEPAPPPSGLGAVSSTGADPAARKGNRVVRPSSASVDAALDTVSVEPAATIPPGPGAITSSGIDPAARKARTSTSASSRASTGDAQSVGATISTSSRHEDPAARKAARSARAAASTSGRAGTHSGSAEISENGNRESEVLARTNLSGEAPGQVPAQTPVQAPSPIPVEPPSNHRTSADSGLGDYTPVVTDDNGHMQSQSGYVETGRHDEESPVTYAGLGLTGPDIVGAETGGFEAFVAGEDKPEEIAAMEVVTDADIEEEDKKKQKRVLRLGAVVFCILLIVIVVPVAVVVPGGEEDKVVNVTDAPTMAPSAPPTGATFAELYNTLRPLYPDDESFEAAFSSYDTPQYQAADWAANTAPLSLKGDDPRMISRYALATFYFATNGNHWERCGVGSTKCDEGREWLTVESECAWFAVVCGDGGDNNVLELFFPPTGPTGNNVSGTLPFELTFLPSVKRIVLSQQSLTGSIPEHWSRMTALHTLLLGNNQLTGTFPDFLFSQNTLLGTLYVSSNKLAGTLPLFTSASLESLRFDSNMFTGPIPPEFGGFAALQDLYADNNALEGDLPEELYSLLALQFLRLGNNTNITGTISESVGNLQSLQQLQIMNTGMAGPLPAGLFDLINLTALELGFNTFSGPLSEAFANLTNIKHILLNNNTFTGTIPAVFQGFQNLQTLELQGNDLTGTVSDGICSRTGDGFFDINRLTADCLGDPPQVSCDCCHECF